MAALRRSFAFALVLLLVWPALADETNNPPATVTAETTNAPNSEEMLRTYLQLQEQIHSLQLEVKESRKESDEAAARTAEALANRLQAIEQSIAVQRAQELDALRGSGHIMLIVAGTFAGLGFLAILLMAYFQWRMVSRLADVSGAMHSGLALTARPALALGPGEAAVAASPAVEQSSARLLGAIDHLEKRILEFEHSTRSPLGQGNPGSNGPQQVESNGTASPASPSVAVESPVAGPGSAGIPAGEPGELAGKAAGALRQPSSAPAFNGDKVAALLEKGQSLLNQDKADEALACFNEALSLEPSRAEAFFKKGTALERLRKPEEAIECYDKALAADSSLTIAWIHKGGLFNRLERFVEALECYEQALRTQEQRKG